MRRSTLLIAGGKWSFRAGQGQAARKGKRGPRRLRPELLELEGRLLLTIDVKNLSYSLSVENSLPWAVAQANADTQSTTIEFTGSVFNTPQTITLGGSALPLSNTNSGVTETIEGPAAGVTISGNQKSGVFEIGYQVTANLSNLTITDGNASRGGGLDNDGKTKLTDCTISGNLAGTTGGGVYNGFQYDYSRPQLTLTDCTVSGNQSSGSGGGLSNSGVATLSDCTVSGNSAKNSGGGVDQYGYALAMTECTISGNSAGSNGGGVFAAQQTVFAYGCTISANSAAGQGGGLFTFRLGLTVGYAVLADAIVAGNTNSSGSNSPSDIQNDGGLSGHNNLVGSVSNSGGSMGGLPGNGNITLSSLSQLGLAPLGNYGGPTETMALLPGSKAIRAGAPFKGMPNTDQRGFPLDSPIDIGAFQSQPSLVVNTTSDGNTSPFGTELTLREAVNIADLPETAESGANESITFSPSVFANPQTITLTQGPLEVGNASANEPPAPKLTITGPQARLTISGGNESGVFQVLYGGTVTLSGLTITGGSTSEYGNGAGLDNWGTTTLTDCTITGNTASGAGGGVCNESLSTLTMNDCTISHNQAGTGGGGFSNAGGTTLKDCTISGNTSTNGDGGGIYAGGSASLTDCTISENKAPNGSGGGLANTNAGVLILSGCTVSGNTAGDEGGGLSGAGTTNLLDGTISGNTADDDGGGVWAFGGFKTREGGNYASLFNCTVSNNNAGDSGGGLFISGATAIGKTILVDTIVAGNQDSSTNSPSDIVNQNKSTLSGNNNLIGDGGAGALAGNDNIVLTKNNISSLLLAPLGNYGGPTQTMAALPGSAAIGEGVVAEYGGGTETETDQCGNPFDKPNPDIGAFQTQDLTLTVEQGTPQSATIDTGFGGPLVVAVAAHDDTAEPVKGGVVSFTAQSFYLPFLPCCASASLSSPAPINSSGVAEVTATANGTAGGPYTVTPSISILGTPANVEFELTNMLPAKSKVVVTSGVVDDGRLASLSLKAQVVPAVPVVGAAVPTGTVIFEIVQGKKTKVLGTAKLSGGKATLSAKIPASLVNQPIEVIYSGDRNFLTSTEETKLHT